MEKKFKHILVCINRRPPGHPKGCCVDKGAMDILNTLLEEIENRNLWDRVKLNTTNCLGPCGSGPTVVIYPEGVWYGRVTKEKAKKIITDHILQDKVIEEILIPEEEII